MWLTPTQIAAANYALRDLIARRTLGGQPIRQELADLQKKLVAASGYGTHSAPPPGELTPEDLIGTTEAAAILRCSTRWVRRIHADLDGQTCGGQWVFRRNVVADYANSKGIDDECNRVPPAGGRAVSS